MDHRRTSSKESESLYQLFDIASSMYQKWITEEKVVKLRSLYIKCLKFHCLCIKSGSSRKSFKVAESLYPVFKVAFSVCQDWIIKEKVIKYQVVKVALSMHHEWITK